MTAEQLKASLITYAMEGGLSAPWRKEHNYSFELWRNLPLSKICHTMTYGTTKKSSAEGDVVVIRMGNLQNGEINWSKLAYTSDREDIEKYLLIPGDVLFNRTNSPELVGKTSIYRGERPAIYAGYLIKLDYDKNMIIGEYLNYIMNSQEERKFCADVRVNGVCQANINAKKIGAFNITVPPIPEQQYIVSCLNELMPIVEEYGKSQRALQALEMELPGKLRASLLQQAIMGKLVPQLDDEPAVDIDSEELEDVPFAIPEKWKWVRLGTCITLKSGRDLERNKILELEEGIPYLTGASQIDNGRIIINRWTKNPAVISKKGDLLLTCKGTVGKVAINNVGDMHIARQIMAIDTNQIVSLMYMKLFIIFSSIELARSARSMIPGISRNDVLNLPFPLPPLAEQHRIIARMNEIFPFFDTMTDADTLS